MLCEEFGQADYLGIYFKVFQFIRCGKPHPTHLGVWD